MAEYAPASVALSLVVLGHVQLRPTLTHPSVYGSPGRLLTKLPVSRSAGPHFARSAGPHFARSYESNVRTSAFDRAPPEAPPSAHDGP